MILCSNETCELAEHCARSLKSGLVGVNKDDEFHFIVPYKVGRCMFLLLDPNDPEG